METFIINGIEWNLYLVEPYSRYLTWYDGTQKLGITYGITHEVYVSNALSNRMKEDVICHELCHCICYSYGIKMPINEEERLCNFVRDYGREVIYILDNILRNII